MPPEAKRREWLLHALAFGVTIGLLCWLGWRYYPYFIGRALAGADLPPLLLGALILCASHLYGVTDRWRRILRLIRQPVSFGEAWVMRMGGAPLKFFTPFRAGDLLKVPYLHQQHGAKWEHSISALAFEKFTLVLGLAPALVLRVILYGDMTSLVSTILVVCLMIVLMLHRGQEMVLRLIAPLGERIRAWSEGLMLAFKEAGPWGTLGQISYAALIVAAEAVVLGLCLRAVGADISVEHWWTMLPAVLFAGMIPVTFAGLGARESALVLLFPAQDPARLIAAGLLFFLLARLGIAVAGLPWTPVFLRRIGVKKAG